MVEFLIESGAKCNAQNNEALIKASKTGKINEVKLLIENKANFAVRNFEAVKEARRAGNKDIIAFFTNMAHKLPDRYKKSYQKGLVAVTYPLLKRTSC